MDDVYLNFFYALIGVVLYNVKSKHANYLKVLSGLYLALFLTDIIYQDVDAAAAKVLWFLVSFSIITMTVLRIKSKKNLTLFEIIKLLAAMLLLTVPLTFYDISGLWGAQWLITLHTSIVPILASIYIYDRFILRNDEIGSRTLFALIIQTIIIIALLVYAFDIKTEKDFRQIKHKEELYKKDLTIDRLKNELEDCKSQ